MTTTISPVSPVSPVSPMSTPTTTPFRTFNEAIQKHRLLLSHLRERQRPPTSDHAHSTSARGCARAEKQAFRHRIRAALQSLPHLLGSPSPSQTSSENKEQSGYLHQPCTATPAMPNAPQNADTHRPLARSPQTSKPATMTEREAMAPSQESSPARQHSKKDSTPPTKSSTHSTTHRPQ